MMLCFYQRQDLFTADQFQLIIASIINRHLNIHNNKTTDDINVSASLPINIHTHLSSYSSYRGRFELKFDQLGNRMFYKIYFMYLTHIFSASSSFAGCILSLSLSDIINGGMQQQPLNIQDTLSSTGVIFNGCVKNVRIFFPNIF